MKKILIVAGAILVLAMYGMTMAEGQTQNKPQVQKVSMDGWYWTDSPTGNLLCYQQTNLCMNGFGGGGGARPV